MNDTNDETTDEQQGTPEHEEGAKELLDAAKALGAVEVIEEIDDSRVDSETERLFNLAPKTKDILGAGKIEFHQEMPQVKFEILIGHTFLLQDIRIVEGWDGFYGTSNFGLIMVQLRDGRKCTSLAGGIAVIKQLRGFLGNIQARKTRYPIKVILTQKPGGQGPYYLFE